MKKLFSTPTKAVISTVCICLVVVLCAVVIVFSVSKDKDTTSESYQSSESVSAGDSSYLSDEAQSESGAQSSQSSITGQSQSSEQATSSQAITTTGNSSASVSSATVQSNETNLEKAKQTALSDANVPSQDAVITKAQLDYDNGRAVYEIEFIYSGKEYDYELDAKTGSILKKEIANSNSAGNTNNNSSANYITKEQANKIAAKDAGVNINSVTFSKSQLDYDNGRAVYEIEFIYSGKEYDYELDAKTGSILKKEIGNSGSAGNANNNSSANYITKEQANKIAAKDAGVNINDVVFSKSQLDIDDGKAVYEIEFKKGRTDYEYKIDAVTGKIIEREKEAF